MRRSNFTWQLNNCFMCNNPYDQKPLIEEDDEKSGSPLFDFKRGFSLFCKILNDVHNFDSDLLTKFAEYYENAEIEKEVDLFMGARGKFDRKSGVFESPCCSLCYDALVTILGLQKAIEESQASQLDHVKNLKEVLKVSSDAADDIVGYNDKDFWTTIRRQLVACLTPTSSFSDDGDRDNDDANEFPCLEGSDNDECPIPTPTLPPHTSITFVSVSKNKNILDTNFVLGGNAIKTRSFKSKEDKGEPSRKIKQRFDNITQENDPSSFKSIIAKSSVKPCSVHLEKIDLKKVTHIDNKPRSWSSSVPLGGIRYKRVIEKGRVKFSKNIINKRKSTPKKQRKAETDMETDDNPLSPEDCGSKLIPEMGVRRSKQKALSVIRSSLKEISGSEGEDNKSDTEDLLKNKIDDGDFEPYSETCKDVIETDKKRRKLSGCDDFHIVGQDHLLFQHTLIKYSPLGFQCLEETCGKEVGGTDFNAFQELRLHILGTHFGSQYTNTPKSCPVCKKEYRNGTVLRRHFERYYICHKYKQICESCWKPFPALGEKSYSPKTLKDHTLTHKSEEDIAADNVVKEQKRLIGVKEYFRRLISGKAVMGKGKVKGKRGNDKKLLEKNESKVYVLKEDFLMYLFSLLKLTNGEIECQERDCDKKVGSFEFDAIYQMKTHIKMCHKERNASRSCKICGEEVKDGIQFRRHQFHAHSTSPITYLCEICLKPVKVGESLSQLHRIHTMSHLNDQELQAALGNRKKDLFLEKIQAAKMGQEEEYMEGGVKFKCQECGKELSRMVDLKSHLVTHQPTYMRKKFECSYCHVKLLSQAALQSHIERLHMPDLQKKFRDCPVCNRRFHHRDGERFRAHVRRHNNETPFVCELCGKGFVSKNSLNSHIMSHNETNDFQCEYCEKNYKHSLNLARHKRIAHKEISKCR